MQRFHLDLWEAGNCDLDDEGVELSGLDAAIAFARCTLVESLASDLEASREPVNRCIVISDSRRLTLGQFSTSELLAFMTDDAAFLPEAELNLG